MAHFAEIDDSGIVGRVLVVPDEYEHMGQEYLANIVGLGGTWIQTSYNKTIRKNYAGPGSKYDPDLDAFIPIKLHKAWILNKDTVQWEPPFPRPDLNNYYVWSDETDNWMIYDEWIANRPQPATDILDVPKVVS